MTNRYSKPQKQPFIRRSGLTCMSFSEMVRLQMDDKLCAPISNPLFRSFGTAFL